MATLASIDSEFATKVGPWQEEELKNASAKHFDETGMRVGKKTEWLHVISNDQGTDGYQKKAIIY